MAGHPEKLRVGISTHFYAAATAEAARKTFPYYHEYLRPKAPGGRGFIVDQAQFDAGTQRGNAIMIGSSTQLIEKITTKSKKATADALPRFHHRKPSSYMK